MTLDPCDPCASTCIPGNISNDQFKQAVLQTLCVIQSNTATAAAGLLGIRSDTPTATVGNGEPTQFKTNDVSAQYVETANKVATWVAATVAGAAGGITTGGASILTNSAKIKAIRVLNTTDQIVQISLDAGTTWISTAAATNGQASFDLGVNGRWAASNVHARSIGSNTSSGSLYFSALI